MFLLLYCAATSELSTITPQQQKLGLLGIARYLDSEVKASIAETKRILKKHYSNVSYLSNFDDEGMKSWQEKYEYNAPVQATKSHFKSLAVLLKNQEVEWNESFALYAFNFKACQELLDFLITSFYAGKILRAYNLCVEEKKIVEDAIKAGKRIEKLTLPDNIATHYLWIIQENDAVNNISIEFEDQLWRSIITVIQKLYNLSEFFLMREFGVESLEYIITTMISGVDICKNTTSYNPILSNEQIVLLRYLKIASLYTPHLWGLLTNQDQKLPTFLTSYYEDRDLVIINGALVPIDQPQGNKNKRKKAIQPKLEKKTLYLNPFMSLQKQVKEMCPGNQAAVAFDSSAMSAQEKTRLEQKLAEYIQKPKRQCILKTSFLEQKVVKVPMKMTQEQWKLHMQKKQEALRAHMRENPEVGGAPQQIEAYKAPEIAEKIKTRQDEYIVGLMNIDVSNNVPEDAAPVAHEVEIDWDLALKDDPYLTSFRNKGDIEERQILNVCKAFNVEYKKLDATSACRFTLADGYLEVLHMPHPTLSPGAKQDFLKFFERAAKLYYLVD